MEGVEALGAGTAVSDGEQADWSRLFRRPSGTIDEVELSRMYGDVGRRGVISRGLRR
jgi:hypothetical protein